MEWKWGFPYGPIPSFNVFKPPCFFREILDWEQTPNCFDYTLTKKNTSPGSIRPTFDEAPKIGFPPLQDFFADHWGRQLQKYGRVQEFNGTSAKSLKECGKTNAINHSMYTYSGMIYITHKNDDFGDGLWHWVDPTLGCRYVLKSKQWTCVEAELEHPFYGEIRNIRLDSLCALGRVEKLMFAHPCDIPAKSSHQRPTSSAKGSGASSNSYSTGLGLNLISNVGSTQCAINQLQKSKDDHFYECGEKNSSRTCFARPWGIIIPNGMEIYIYIIIVLLYIYIFIYKT